MIIELTKLTDNAYLPKRTVVGYELRACLAKPIRMFSRYAGPWPVSTGLSIYVPEGVEAQIRTLDDSDHPHLVVQQPVVLGAGQHRLDVPLFNCCPEGFEIDHGTRIALMVFSAVLAPTFMEVS